MFKQQKFKFCLQKHRQVNTMHRQNGALLLVAMLMLLPLAISGIVVLSQGESLLTLSLFLVGYLLYLSIWILIIVSISLWAKSNSVSFSRSNLRKSQYLK